MKVLTFFVALLFSVFSLNLYAKPAFNAHSNFHGGTVNSLPPGLQGKALPHGLEKKHKTPYGWSQGKKKGWSIHKKK